jgi:phosphoglycolate phosphatase
MNYFSFNNQIDMDIKKYKHVIWDWNGTLFNDVALCCDIMNGIRSRRNMPQITLEKYRKVFTFPVKKYYEELGLDVSNENWEILSHEFINDYEKRKYECALYDDALNVLHNFSNLGITQSILSAYSQNTLEEIVAKFNIDVHFEKLVGLDNIYAESKMANGKKWMSELSHSEHEVLLIGDTVHDYEVASEIGADCLLISSGHQVKENLIGCECTIINVLNEIKFD